MPGKKLELIIVTTSRADWGILSPLARALTLCSDVNLTVAAGNMHLLPAYGMTVTEVEADGFTDIERLALPESSSGAPRQVDITSALAQSLGALFERKHPDGVIMLGDRYELLGAAMAALVCRVPIVHLHGGEVSEGAIDDSVRHALSKLASLHLVATERAAERLRLMGEEPYRIIHTGAIGVESMLVGDLLSADELSASLDGFDISPERTLLVTFHPVTRHPDGLPTEKQLDNLLGALEDVTECNVLITYPNNDPDGDEILGRLKEFARLNSDRVKLVGSLGHKRYISALHNVRAVVGNTSSGLLEAPSTPAYTIDIGPRQQGRERAASVLHVGDDRKLIADAIRKVMKLERRVPLPSDNPYYRAGALETAVKAITDHLATLPPLKKNIILPND